MMVMKLLLCIISSILFLFPSCSLRHDIPVTLVLPEEHPFEENSERRLWYTLSFFDGKSIREMHVPAETDEVTLSVAAGGLSVFAAKPLGELGAAGGFFEPGDGRTVFLLPEYGPFAEMLIRAASYRPEPVSALSMDRVVSSVDDLAAVDETAFLSDVFKGTLQYGITLNERITFSLDTLPSGTWISERRDVPPFSVSFSGRPVSFSLYPGVYRYAEMEKHLLLTLIVSEEGEISHMVSALPVW